MVGAVLVYDNRIIGEGWHKHYGQAHAEVNCLASVAEPDRGFIASSTLYVSLEPCAHFGKTAPCTDLIIRNKIPCVVIGCRDTFEEVDGRGINHLESAGVKVEMVSTALQHECRELNKRFFTFHRERRPYIILKWAQTGNGKMADAMKPERLLISSGYANRVVHRWRSEETAILVGTNTALLDNPALTTRLWNGPSPTRLVIDLGLRLPGDLKLFNGGPATIVFNQVKHEMPADMDAELLKQGGLFYYRINALSVLKEILSALYRLQVQSVLVEGGAQLLQSFIDDGLWDETRIITNEEMMINTGLDAPLPKQAVLCDTESVGGDLVETYYPANEDY